MNVGVIGRGFVGGAIYKFLKDSSPHAEYSYDIKDDMDINDGYLNIIDKCEIIYVCLPTPMDKDGRCFTGIVEDSLSLLDRYAAQLSVKPIVLIKSTLVPGTSERFNLQFRALDVIINPEFLTERNAEEDFKNSPSHLIGFSRDTPTVGLKVEKYYKDLWPSSNIIKTSHTEAELIKYIVNSYLAVRVGYANHVYEMCSILKIDYNDMVENAIQANSRIGRTHWKVPGPDGKFGFGGSCFPKDLSGLIKLFEDKKLDASIFKATQDYNLKVRDKNVL